MVLSSEKVYLRLGSLLRLKSTDLRPVPVKAPAHAPRGRAAAYMPSYHAVYSRGKPPQETVDTLEHEQLHGVHKLLGKRWGRLASEIIASQGVVDEDLRGYLKREAVGHRRQWLEQASEVRVFLKRQGVDGFIALHLAGSNQPAQAAREAIRARLLSKRRLTREACARLKRKRESVRAFLDSAQEARESRYLLE